jgi:hypothetical protein
MLPMKDALLFLWEILVTHDLTKVHRTQSRFDTQIH